MLENLKKSHILEHLNVSSTLWHDSGFPVSLNFLNSLVLWQLLPKVMPLSPTPHTPPHHTHKKYHWKIQEIPLKELFGSKIYMYIHKYLTWEDFFGSKIYMYIHVYLTWEGLFGSKIYMYIHVYLTWEDLFGSKIYMYIHVYLTWEDFFGSKKFICTYMCI